MRLSWNEVRVRAADFAREWKDAAYEKGETQSFYNKFFEVFDVKRSKVARYEEHVIKLDNSSGYIDLFWPGVLVVEQKSAGRDLVKAYKQAAEYSDALDDEDYPQYILTSDFQNFELHNLDERKTVNFRLRELPDHVEEFGFMLGVQKRTFRDQDPVNVKASQLVGKLHLALKSSGYDKKHIDRFMMRLVFCLFADDTGIFESSDILFDFIEERTSQDGADLGLWLSQLFQVLDTPVDERQTNLDEDLAQFPYINGELFDGPLEMPSFDSSMRQLVLEACSFNWSGISPAIFGALFQSVMTSEKRREQGAHYTTEKNILKVIGPLFLDDLQAEFSQLKNRKDGHRIPLLKQFQKKLSQLRLLDPACGCGNFLIIAYRELRLVEMDVLKEIHPEGQLDAMTGELSIVDVDQFYGIEIDEFAVRIAKAALWMMDHIMNNILSAEFGEVFVRIPLKTAPHIMQGDALEFDWGELLPAKDCSYVLGNPPFAGSKYQSAFQRAQVHRIADLGKSGGTLDFVSAWFIKAGKYIQQSKARIGFVATNSITQGEQVAQLWPVLFGRCQLEIAFAHRTFAWGSDAPGVAHVHVVIIGLDCRGNARKKKLLFSYPDIKGEPEETIHSVISPYLFDAGKLTDPHLTVREESSPINGMRGLVIGSKPIDGGHYIFDESKDERTDFLILEPDAETYFRPYIGAREFLQGGDRWILALRDADPEELKNLKHVQERISKVSNYRLASKSAPTVELATKPRSYHVNVLPEEPFLVIPEVSSERRDYVPIGWLEPPTIPSNLVRVLERATLVDFALLTSAMHMAWLRHIGGRLKSDYRYSIGLVYNTFPTPLVFRSNEQNKLSKLVPLAEAVLNARKKYPDTSLATLYTPNLMPGELREAHRKLDRAVDKLYRQSPFNSERERIEYLLKEYETMKNPLTAIMGTKRKKRKHTTGLIHH